MPQCYIIIIDRTSKENKMTNIRFSVNGYRFAHGKLPRGKGHWAFEFEGETYWFNGTYTEGKKFMAQKVKDKGLKHAFIVVGS